MVDSIEANIEHTSIHVGQANTTLNQALVYQKKARQKKIILSVFCVALLLIILLVIYLWRRTWSFDNIKWKLEIFTIVHILKIQT